MQDNYQSSPKVHHNYIISAHRFLQLLYEGKKGIFQITFIFFKWELSKESIARKGAKSGE